MKPSLKSAENLPIIAFITLFVAGLLNMGNNIAHAQTEVNFEFYQKQINNLDIHKYHF